MGSWAVEGCEKDGGFCRCVILERKAYPASASRRKKLDERIQVVSVQE